MRVRLGRTGAGWEATLSSSATSSSGNTTGGGGGAGGRGNVGACSGLCWQDSSRRVLFRLRPPPGESTGEVFSYTLGRDTAVPPSGLPPLGCAAGQQEAGFVDERHPGVSIQPSGDTHLNPKFNHVFSDLSFSPTLRCIHTPIAHPLPPPESLPPDLVMQHQKKKHTNTKRQKSDSVQKMGVS